MLEMSSHYSQPYLEVKSLNVRTLSEMYSGMLANKARERLHRIEELACIKMDSKKRNEFIDSLYKQIDSKYTKQRQVDEDELKRILGNVGFKPSN